MRSVTLWALALGGLLARATAKGIQASTEVRTAPEAPDLEPKRLGRRGKGERKRNRRERWT